LTAGAEHDGERWGRRARLATLPPLALGAIAAASGLFWPGGGGPDAVTSVWGEVVSLHGRGLYRHDTAFFAGGAQGSDAVTLLLALPLGLALALRRTTAAGLLVSAGVMAWLVYVYASLALGAVVYNPLFLVYVATYASAGIALLITVTAAAGLRRGTVPRAPGLALFLTASGVMTLGVWLGPLAASLLAGSTPALLDHYTGRVTDALDLGIITPACFAAAILVARRRPLGVLLAAPLLVLEAMLLPMIVAQLIRQLSLGVAFAPAEIAGPIGGFLALSALALIFLVRLLRRI
jgi:hypothetical protein